MKKQEESENNLKLNWKLKLEAYIKEKGVRLSGPQWTHLERYLSLVRKANAKTNLTSAETVEELALRHAADGLTAVAPLKRLLGERPRILDIGAGAGFIGFSIKIAWPEAQVHVLESSSRKFQFLNMAAMELGLKDLKVHWKRADLFGPAIGAGEGYDAVMERAVAPLDEALRLCLPLCLPGGYAIAYQTEVHETPKLRQVLAKYGAVLHETFPYRLPGEAHDRRLLIYRRAGEPARG